MNLKNAETFVWAATLGSFTAAAVRLGATQPTISARIAALEEELGVKLFDRMGRKMKLTPTGLALLPRAERYVALAAEIKAAIGDRNALTGLVRLGTAETPVHDWIPELVRQVHANYPGVSLELYVDLSVNLREQLVARELDIAILIGPVSAPNMINRALCAYEMAWVAGPAMILPPGRLTLEAMAKVPIVTFLRQSRPRLQIQQALSRPDLPTPRISGSSSVATMIRMAEDGVGLAAVPLDIVRKQIEDGRLRLVDTDLPLASLDFTSTWPVSPPNPLADLIGRLADNTAKVGRSNVAVV